MLVVLNDSIYVCFALITLLAVWKASLFFLNQKRIRFNIHNFFWYSKISISGTYSETAKNTKILLNKLSYGMLALIFAEIVFVFCLLLFSGN